MQHNKIYPNVKTGKGARIGAFVVIGEPPRGKAAGELETVIGDGAKIRSHSVIYSGCRIGDNFETGHGVMIREGNEIGDDVSIGTQTVIEKSTTIGNRVRIHSKAFIPEYTKIKNGAWIGPNVVITNAEFPNSSKAKKFLKGATVEEDAKIGANSTILPGVVIGKNSLVGAGSVVTKDVPDNTVVVGNPARRIKDIKELRYENGEKPY